MNKKVAKKIVKKIMSDLDDRSGFDILHLDSDILSEIRETWVGIILSNMPPEPTVKGEPAGVCGSCGCEMHHQTTSWCENCGQFPPVA